MFLELFHMRLSWYNVIILYPCGHKDAYTLSEFLPQTQKCDNQLEYFPKTALKLDYTPNYGQKKVRIFSFSSRI